LTAPHPTRTIIPMPPALRPFWRAFALGFSAALGAALALTLLGIVFELVLRPWG
jgi:hypothetical protein